MRPTRVANERRVHQEWSDLNSILEAAYQAKLFVLLVGPPGTGKTSAADTLGQWARVELIPVTMSADLYAQQAIGQHMHGEDGRWRFQEGPVSAAFLHGKILSLNEIDRTPDGVTTTLYGVLDDENVARLVLPPDRVYRREQFFCVATTNVPVADLSLPEPLRGGFPVRLAVQRPNPAAVPNPQESGSEARHLGLLRPGESRLPADLVPPDCRSVEQGSTEDERLRWRVAEDEDSNVEVRIASSYDLELVDTRLRLRAGDVVLDLVLKPVASDQVGASAVFTREERLKLILNTCLAIEVVSET